MDYDFILTNAMNFNVLLHINPLNLNESFVKDIYNFTHQDERFENNGIYYDNWTRKLVAAIEQTFCEGFVVFQDDILKFAQTFREASLYSKWRSMNNSFLFIYNEAAKRTNYFEDTFFQNNINILVIHTTFKNSSEFYVKTTKFIGSLNDQPQQLHNLTTYYAVEKKFSPPRDLLSPHRLQNLQGREIIVGAFDYRPFVVVDYERQPQYYDYAENNPAHRSHVDGTEVRLVHTFCELYNCTVQVDTSEKEDWGVVYSNFTGTGLMGMVLEGKTHMALGGLFLWDLAHDVMDQTTFIGRSGVTCLVPVPQRITSWTLPLRPFEFSLWLSVAACLVLESAILQLTRYYEKTLLQELPQYSWLSSIKFGIYTTLKLFVSQGSDYVVQSYTVRMALVACYMIDIIITSIYGGGLAAILTVPKLDEAADSVERLYKHNLTWTATSTDWIVSIMPQEGEENEPISTHLSRNFRVYSTEQARKYAIHSNMAFALERLMYGHFGNGDFITPAALQHLKLMTDDIYFVFTVSMVPRLWPHLPKYNDMILNWRSSGLDKYWEWKIVADYMNAREQNQMEASKSISYDVGPVQLDMDNFAGLIVIWFVGILLSTVAFAAEWVVYSCFKKV